MGQVSIDLYRPLSNRQLIIASRFGGEYYLTLIISSDCYH